MTWPATRRVLALQNGPCILVAHSYGGAVITEAGNDTSVVGLVYVAAHMPDAGERSLRTESVIRAILPNQAQSGKRRTVSLILIPLSFTILRS